MEVVLLSENATLPTRGTPGSVGYDLYSAMDEYLPSNGVRKIATDISIKVPAGTYGRVAPRSSLAVKHISVGAGVVDPDYRGHVQVVLYNHSTEQYKINKGDRIAQLILEKVAVVEVIKVDSLDETQRKGGFGFTNAFNAKRGNGDGTFSSKN